MGVISVTRAVAKIPLFWLLCEDLETVIAPLKLPSDGWVAYAAKTIVVSSQNVNCFVKILRKLNAWPLFYYILASSKTRRAKEIEWYIRKEGRVIFLA